MYVASHRKYLYLQIIMIFSWVDYTGLANRTHYNVFADLIGWGMTLTTVLSIIVTAIYVVSQETGSLTQVCVARAM